MNRIKTLITAVVLMIYMVSGNVYATEIIIENETPFLPLIEEKNDEIVDDNKESNSTSNSTSSDNADSNNNSGGNSYRPSTKPTDKTETQQESTQTENNIKTFADIKQDDWFYNDVMFVFNNEIMTGTSESEFSPDTTLNRAMMITILHRIDGDGSVYEKNIFYDVEKNSWYEDAVNWGYENKIVTGTGENTFAPMNNLTREQLCVMLYNYTKYIGAKTELADISFYHDEKIVSEWAKDAVSWAVQEKILTGKGNNTIAPRDCATRAEAAAVIRRYMEKITEYEKK